MKRERIEKCENCGAMGAVLGHGDGEGAQWWWTKAGLCISCLRFRAKDPTNYKRIARAYSRLHS